MRDMEHYIQFQDIMHRIHVAYAGLLNLYILYQTRGITLVQIYHNDDDQVCVNLKML